MTDCSRFVDGIATGGRSVVLVEGVSDQIAVEALAARLGHQIAREGIAIVPMGGVHAIGRYLERLGPRGAGLRIAGLYDAGEEDVVRRGLERAGYGSSVPLTRATMEKLGFYVCVVDLENELIRALGADNVESVIAAKDELHAFRSLQKQPAWRGRDREAQLRRFLGSGARRKWEYARFLVDALDPAQVPRPLHLVLANAIRGSPPCPGD